MTSAKPPISSNSASGMRDQSLDIALVESANTFSYELFVFPRQRA
jgi:hypothetical protein